MLAHSFLIESSSKLLVTRTGMSPPFFLVVSDPILFILAGNKDMHKILDEFQFRPRRTTDYGVRCP